MINLANYKVEGNDLSGNKYISVTEIPETVGKSKEELVMQCFHGALSDIVRTYGCETDYLLKLICEIPSNELFTYETNGMLLLKENAIYTEKYETNSNKFVKRYYNVFLGGTPFFQTVLIQYGILKKIMDTLYPGLLQEFSSQVPLTEEEQGFLKMFTEHPDYPLSPLKVLFITKMTLGDVATYIKNPSTINMCNTVTDFALYTNSVYLTLGKRTFRNGHEYEDAISLSPAWMKDMTFEEYLSAPLQQFVYDKGKDKPCRILNGQPIRGSEIEELYPEKLERLSKYFKK